jgi:CheY-like chemotaxis protein
MLLPFKLSSVGRWRRHGHIGGELQRPIRRKSMILSPVTVLVVEDEELLSELMVEELREVGFNVLKAGASDEALRIIESEAVIDVLFTDIRLPGGLDGWDLAERFRAKNRFGPVIYATAYPNGPIRRVSQSGFLPKPYLPSAIVAEIRRLSGPA